MGPESLEGFGPVGTNGVWGWDIGREDKTVLGVRRDGFVFVCEMPKGLGNVTRLETRNGRVIAHTESGTPMIVPVR